MPGTACESSDAHESARAILLSAIRAADPGPATARAAARTIGEVPDNGRLRIVAVGKAALTMTRAALAAIDEAGALSRVVSALAIVPAPGVGDEPSTPSGVRIIEAAHPLPDARSAAAGAALVQEMQGLAGEDVVFVLLSGGASSLAVAPRAPVSVDEYARTVELLMHAGANIGDLNTVRRAIDTLKGGGLAARAGAARVVGLVLSDVVGDPLHVIASGPLTCSPTGHAEAVGVLHHYHVWERCPQSVRTVLSSRRPDIDIPPNVTVEVIAGNRSAVDGAAAAARSLGYEPMVLETPLTGEARDAGAAFALAADDTLQRAAASNTARPACVVAGGETTVTVSGSGRGGRNQEFVLAACLSARSPRMVFGAVGTDGIDGPTDAAGAVSSHADVARVGLERARSALERNDSHTVLEEAGALLRTGPTGTNVADVMIALSPDAPRGRP